MHTRPSSWISAVVALGLLMMWCAPPGMARALDVAVGGDGYAVFTVAATPGADALWLDVEAPGLGAADMVVQIDGEPVVLLDTPFGAGAVLPHDGAAITVVVGLWVDADPDLSVTLADAEGRILLTDSARVALQAVAEDQVPPPPPATTPPASAPPADHAPASTPPASSRPPGSPPPGPPPASTPRPGLPGSGADAPALVAGVSALLIGIAAVLGSRKRGERS